MDWRRLAKSSQELHQPVVHRTTVKSMLSETGGGDVAINHRNVRWCTRLSGEPSMPELNAQRRTRRSREFTEDATAKIHRTIRCVPDCPVSQRCLRSTVGSAINGRHVADPTVTWSHRTVRCAKGTEDPTIGFARKGRRSCTGKALFMFGGAPDCPVRHPTKGKNCLPN
jgi:hypothetical protein